jgi:enoyl-CoA hydratase/carnithine racemase
MSESVQADVGRVTVKSDWAVATICLDRPDKHNALTPEMLAQLEQILMTLDSDRDTRVVLLTAVGDR